MSEPYVSEEDIAAVAELGRQGIRLYAVPVSAVYYVLAPSAKEAARWVSNEGVPEGLVVVGDTYVVDDTPGSVESGVWSDLSPMAAGLARVLQQRSPLSVPYLTVDQWGAAYAELTRRAVK